MLPINIIYLYKMLFLKNEEKKIIFGWSGKCGCTHIKKIFYYFQNNRLDNGVHRPEEYTKEELIYDDSYTIFIFIRNPYERLVSGFLHQYKSVDTLHSRAQWRPDKKLTFENFVEELVTNDFKRINKHHFTPQLSENWTEKLRTRRKTYIYDINNIPYDFLEILFEKKIPKELIEFRGEHSNTKPIKEDLDFKPYEKIPDNFTDYRPATKLFYSEEIKRDVTIFYSKDLVFFKENGFSYTVPE